MKNKKLLSLFAAALMTLGVVQVCFAQENPPPKSKGSTTRLYSSATEFGFCSGSDYYFCSLYIVRIAEQSALDESERECISKKGKAAALGDCSSVCFPFYMPPNAPFQSVDCTAQCYLNCELP